MNSLPTLALLATLADGLKVNDFTRPEAWIWVKQTFGLGDYFTFFLNLGDNLTYYENEDAGGVNHRTMLVGDKTYPYVRINDHGTGLKGMVSVHMSCIFENGQALINIEVYPLTVESGPLAGLIWLDDVDNIGNSPSHGLSPVFSVDHLSYPVPADHRLVNRMIRGFSLGLVLASDSEPSVQFLNNLLGQSRIFFPVGPYTGTFSDNILIAEKREYRKPQGLSDVRFQLIQILYKDSVAVMTQESAVARFLKHARFDKDELDRFFIILHRMVADGWLSEVLVADKFYLVPTPKLLFNL